MVLPGDSQNPTPPPTSPLARLSSVSIKPIGILFVFVLIGGFGIVAFRYWWAPKITGSAPVVKNQESPTGLPSSATSTNPYDPFYPVDPDPLTGRVLLSTLSGSPHSYGYGLKDGQVVCNGPECATNQVISGADIDTFALLYDDYGLDTVYAPYATDKNHVYCDGEILAGADPRTFTPIYALNSTINGYYEIRYAKDKNTVYGNCGVIPGADPVTFSPILDENGLSMGYAKDKKSVYLTYQNSFVVTTEVSSFAFIPYPDSPFGSYGSYTRDSNHVYLGGIAIPEADPDTFTLIPDGISELGIYAKDLNHMYFNGNVIADSNPKTFVILGEYAKDPTHVYYLGKILREADPATFVLFSGDDGLGHYADAKDSKYVYINGQTIPGADPKTFFVHKNP